jgi:hypothetical protein
MAIQATSTGAIIAKEFKKTVRQTMDEAVETQIKNPDLLNALQPADSREPQGAVWPMKIEDFKAGGYIEPGDVILMSRIGSFFAMLTRIFDRSRFAHCAMVFQTPHYGDGIDQTFLIETSMKGVDLGALSHILKSKHIQSDTGLPVDFVVAVKRLETDWASLALRRMAASRMLHFIDADDYNFELMLALASRRTRKLYFNLRRFFRGQAPSVVEFLRGGRRRYLPGEFICSGFVQYAFVDMVSTAVERNLIDKALADKAMEDVLFCRGVTEQSPMEELMACTPSDLANCNKLVWKYLIHRGEVFPVSTSAEVERFMKEDLPRRIKIDP